MILHHWSRHVPVRPRRRGFTLIEVMVAISIFAILVAVAIPRLDFAKYQADAAQIALRGSFQRAQRIAVQRQYDVAVGFDTANRRIRITEDTNVNRVIENTDAITWKPFEEGARYKRPPSELYGRTAAALVGSNLVTLDGLPSIVFLRNGSATSDAAIYVTSAREKPDHFRVVTLTQSTGRTETFRYRAGAWVRMGL